MENKDKLSWAVSMLPPKIVLRIVRSIKMLQGVNILSPGGASIKLWTLRVEQEMQKAQRTSTVGSQKVNDNKAIMGPLLIAPTANRLHSLRLLYPLFSFKSQRLLLLLLPLLLLPLQLSVSQVCQFYFSNHYIYTHIKRDR